MYALLLLLGVSFFFIFFLFSRVPDFEGYFVGSLFLEANLYIVFSFILCIVVYKNSVGKQKLDESKETIKIIGEFIPNSLELKEFFIDFFSKYIYYIAGILFYSAIYLIVQGFFPGLDISYIFLVFNLIVMCLYIFSRKYLLGKDFIIINLVLISLYYIGEHIFYLSGFIQAFSMIDIINIFAVFIFFSITLFDKNYYVYRKIIEQYFIIFFFLELSTLYKWLFDSNISSLGIIAGILGILLLIFTDEIQQRFVISKYASRTWGLLFSSISIIIYIISLWLGLGEIIAYSLGIFCITTLMFLFHQRFCSYFALSVGSLGLNGGAYFLYSQFIQNTFGNIYLCVVYFSLSFFFIYILRKMQTSYGFDIYFFRIISILVNLIGVITFLFFNEISILSIGLLLLGESVYLFFIYYSLRKNNF